PEKDCSDDQEYPSEHNDELQGICPDNRFDTAEQGVQGGRNSGDQHNVDDIDACHHFHDQRRRVDRDGQVTALEYKEYPAGDKPCCLIKARFQASIDVVKQQIKKERQNEQDDQQQGDWKSAPVWQE